METLIINKRHEMPRSKRFLWDIITLALWLSFLYLWKPLLIVFYQIITLKAPAEEIPDWIYDNIASVRFEHAVFMLIGTPIVLILLSRLNRHKESSTHLIFAPEDYSNYFHLDAKELEESIHSQLNTVYHDDHGNIVSVTNQIS